MKSTTMEDRPLLVELELRLFLLKKRTKVAIERNEALLVKMKRDRRQRGELIASLEGRPSPALRDCALDCETVSSSSSPRGSCHSAVFSKEDDASSCHHDIAFDESRDDDDASRSSTEIPFESVMDGERRDVSDSSSYQSVDSNNSFSTSVGSSPRSSSKSSRAEEEMSQEHYQSETNTEEQREKEDAYNGSLDESERQSPL